MAKNVGVYVDAEKLGKKISELLKETGITVPEMAAMVGISEQVAYRYLKGECRPSVQHLVAISRVLGVTIDSLVEAAVA